MQSPRKVRILPLGTPPPWPCHSSEPRHCTLIHPSERFFFDEQGLSFSERCLLQWRQSRHSTGVMCDPLQPSRALLLCNLVVNSKALCNHSKGLCYLHWCFECGPGGSDHVPICTRISPPFAADITRGLWPRLAVTFLCRKETCCETCPCAASPVSEHFSFEPFATLPNLNPHSPPFRSMGRRGGSRWHWTAAHLRRKV